MAPKINNNDAFDENILDNDQDEDEEDEDEAVPTSQPDDQPDEEEMNDDDDDDDENENEDENDNDDDNDDDDDDDDDNEDQNEELEKETENEDDKENEDEEMQDAVGNSVSEAQENDVDGDKDGEDRKEKLAKIKSLLYDNDGDVEMKEDAEKSDLKDLGAEGENNAETENSQRQGLAGAQKLDNDGAEGATEAQGTNGDAGAGTGTETNGTTVKKEVDAKDKFTPEQLRNKIMLKGQLAENFDIIPSVAILYASQIHSLALSAGSRWLFTGGEDGFIRKYDLIASFEGQTPLTVAQKHALVDSITNAGVIMSYWENEQPVKKSSLKLKKTSGNLDNELYEPKLSPVYSLAVQSEALWLLSGLQSGGITLQTVRHQEGSIHAYLDRHTDTVSCLELNRAEDKLISGGWDKKLFEWDLNTGKVITDFKTIYGQISSIQFRPSSELSLDKYSEDTKDDDYDSLFGSDDENNPEKDNKDAKEKRSEKEAERKSDEKSSSSRKKNLLEEGLYSLPPVDNNIFLSSTINGIVNIWDKRTNKCAIELGVPQHTPPWCMSSTWSTDGERVYVGRRNNCVEEFDLKMPYTNNTRDPNVAKTLRFPSLSGPVYTVNAFPNNRHILCGSNDNIRLYDLNLYESSFKKSGSRTTIPFQIIAGHHGGVLSSIYVDPTSRFMISASGDRGWQGSSTEMLLMYELKTL